MNKKKYASNPDYMNLTEIADIMTAGGDKMNHSTARKYLLTGLSKLAYGMLVWNGMSEEEAEKMAPIVAKKPDFHEGMRDLLQNIYSQK